MRLKRISGRFLGGISGMVISFSSWEKAWEFICTNSTECRRIGDKHGKEI